MCAFVFVDGKNTGIGPGIFKSGHKEFGFFQFNDVAAYQFLCGAEVNLPFQVFAGFAGDVFTPGDFTLMHNENRKITDQVVHDCAGTFFQVIGLFFQHMFNAE